MNIYENGMKMLGLAKRMVAIGVLLTCSASVWAAGTAVGTSIDNTATVNFDLGGTPLSIDSNTTSIVVAERLDVVVTLQSGQIQVSPNDVNQAILYTVTILETAPS